MNCWKYNSCGREKGGDKSVELGVCPAAEMDAGEACWLIAGTFCAGKVRGTFAEKKRSCMACDFYQSLSPEHRGRMHTVFESMD